MMLDEEFMKYLIKKMSIDMSGRNIGMEKKLMKSEKV